MPRICPIRRKPDGIVEGADSVVKGGLIGRNLLQVGDAESIVGVAVGWVETDRSLQKNASIAVGVIEDERSSLTKDHPGFIEDGIRRQIERRLEVLAAGKEVVFGLRDLIAFEVTENGFLAAVFE